MFSDYPPPIVYPDTPQARTDVRRQRIDDDLVEFCPHFEQDFNAITPDGYAPIKIACRNRRIGGSVSHNWCYRCPCGFPVSGGKR